MMKILYQDTDLVVLIKDPGTECEHLKLPSRTPAGRPVAAGEFDVPEIPRDSAEPCGPAEDLYCVHRLDRETGGVMVFARTKSAAAALSAAFAGGRVRKTYLALAEGSFPEREGTLEDLLFHDRASNKTYVVKRIRKGVRKASLSYIVRGEFRSAEGIPLTLLEVHLHTGRTHQIRIQFASRKHPLAGDRRYGSRSSFGSFGLWCRELSFPHPVTGEILCFSSEPDFFPAAG